MEEQEQFEFGTLKELGSFSEGICDTDRRNTLRTSPKFSNSSQFSESLQTKSSHKAVKTIKVSTTPVVQCFAEVVN